MSDLVTRAKLKADKLMTSARHTAMRVREKTKRVARVGTRTVLSGGAAFGIGYWEGKNGAANSRILGVPLETAIAVAAHGAGLVGGLDEEMADHAHAIGDGAIAVAGYKLGVETGAGRR